MRRLIPFSEPFHRSFDRAITRHTTEAEVSNDHQYHPGWPAQPDRQMQPVGSSVCVTCSITSQLITTLVSDSAPTWDNPCCDICLSSWEILWGNMKLCCHVVTLQYVMLHILFLWKLNRKMDEVKQNNHIIELYPLKGKGKKLNLYIFLLTHLILWIEINKSKIKLSYGVTVLHM